MYHFLLLLLLLFEIIFISLTILSPKCHGSAIQKEGIVNNKTHSGILETLDNQIPSIEQTIEFLLLSSIVYQFRSTDGTNCASNSSIFHNTSSLSQIYTCHLYERDEEDTQVMIVSSTIRHAIVVVYAGTDDLRNALTDGDILMEPLGPSSSSSSSSKYFQPLNESIRVHAGFNHAVFLNGLFDRLVDTIEHVRTTSCSLCHIYTTGHSLGAADSILTAVALNQYYSSPERNGSKGRQNGMEYVSEQRRRLRSQNGFLRKHPYLEEEQDQFHKQQDIVKIININFGCPKTGNRAWRDYVNNIPTLGIWRFVNGYDLIPRLPDVRFVHVGHTVQLNKHSVKAYWLHNGNETLGLKGVPMGWTSFAFMVAPGAAYQHMISNYQYYLTGKSIKDPIHFYLHDFERISDTVDDYYGSSKGLDDDTKPPLVLKWDPDKKAYHYVMDNWEPLLQNVDGLDDDTKPLPTNISLDLRREPAKIAYNYVIDYWRLLHDVDQLNSLSKGVDDDTKPSMDFSIDDFDWHPDEKAYNYNMGATS